MKTMTLFTAFPLSAEVSELASELQDRLRERIAGSYPRKENLHVTLHYFGPTEETKTADLIRILEECPFPEMFLRFDQFHVFPARKGDAVTLGAEADDVLRKMYRELEQTLQSAGFSPEQKTYQPHITLVRAKQKNVDLKGIEIHPAVMELNEFGLYESLQIHGLRVYRSLYIRQRKEEQYEH